MMLAKIAVSAATFSIDQPYTYMIPPHLEDRVLPGMRVVVPFSTSNRLCEGLILSVWEGKQKGRLKSIASLLDDRPVLDQDGIQLALWMREQFFCTAWSAALTMLPTGLWYVLRESWAVIPGTDRETADRLAENIPGGRQVLDLLFASGGEASLDRIRALDGLKTPGAVLKQLKRVGLVTRTAQVKRKVGDKTEQIAVLAIPPEEALALTERRRSRSPMQYNVTELLAGLGSVSVKELCYFTGASKSTINTLKKNGILTLRNREVFRHALPQMGDMKPLAVLNRQQQEAYEGLSVLLSKDSPEAALLYGVTGSGKTQVYLHLIRNALDQGKGAIVLVPEIALTPSLLRIFLTHFGRKVAVLHSCLPVGERYDEWKRVRDGLAKVVIGTRSAVFAPVRDLGLIILDEEQESSYQSESMVRYHAREVAKYRCTQRSALLVLGSATPAVESRYAAEIGRYRLFTLDQRFNEQDLPEVLLADMKAELRRGNDSGISRLLREELASNLARGEQSILFLNRRGNSRMAVCGECGESPTCPRCSVYLTYHSANGRLMCHYCGYSKPLPVRCPICNGRYHFVGVGTQRIQEQLEELWPGTEIMRMDADTISATQSHEVLLDRFRKKKIPILLGTQMVAKGLDFENVTLVGVVDADLSLYVDNYRAAERTFSLLTQVVGRAGRGDKPGRAVIQTWTPENDIISLAARQDYDSFYAVERDMRRILRFPPFIDLFRLTVTGVEEAQVLRACTLLRRSLDPWVKVHRAQGEILELLGPAPAPVVRVNDRYRYRMILKGKNTRDTRNMLAQLMRTAQQDRANKGLSLLMDVNPMD